MRWRAIPGFEQFYEVSDRGDVRACERSVRFLSKKGKPHFRQKRQRLVRAQVINSGYLVVHLNKDWKRTPRTVHSLVAAAFFGPRPRGYDVAHWNGNKLDNRATNLRYATRSENHRDKKRHGTSACGEALPFSKLTEAAVRSIRRLKLNGRQAAAHFNVSPATISRVRLRQSWKHV